MDGTTRSVDFIREIFPRVLVANLIAAGVVYLLLAFVLVPEPRISNESGATTGAENIALEQGAFVAYLIIAVVIGLRVGKRTFAPVASWLDEGRAPSPPEIRATLAQPLKQSAWIFTGWTVGAAAFAILHAIPGNPMHYAPGYGLFIAAVGLLGGLAASMLSYLLVEQGLRPIFARALESAGSRRPRTLGINHRVIVSWALGSGVALVLIALTPAVSSELARAILFLAPVGLIAGGVTISLAARSIATPMDGMREALSHVERGRFDVRVKVDDASEVGLLQAGFNRMAAGLEERERLHSMFGTYVDPDVAEHILEKGTSLAGEEVDVTVMFLDIKDFMTYVERVPAQEVVATINRLFEVVVPIIHAHEGHVDKFAGDGLLAVFGAPRRNSEHATLAVKTALAIEKAVKEEFQGSLEIGIGIDSGRVVSGNIGGGGRLEFSVIGDTVNVAARIEAATRRTGDVVLVSEATRARLASDDVTMQERREIKLKGKEGPVSLFAVMEPKP